MKHNDYQKHPINYENEKQDLCKPNASQEKKVPQNFSDEISQARFRKPSNTKLTSNLTKSNKLRTKQVYPNHHLNSDFSDSIKNVSSNLEIQKSKIQRTNSKLTLKNINELLRKSEIKPELRIENKQKDMRLTFAKKEENGHPVNNIYESYDTVQSFKKLKSIQSEIEIKTQLKVGKSAKSNILSHSEIPIIASQNIENKNNQPIRTSNTQRNSSIILNSIVNEVQQNLALVISNLNDLDGTIQSKDQSLSRRNRSKSITQLFEKNKNKLMQESKKEEKRKSFQQQNLVEIEGNLEEEYWKSCNREEQETSKKVNEIKTQKDTVFPIKTMIKSDNQIIETEQQPNQAIYKVRKISLSFEKNEVLRGEIVVCQKRQKSVKRRNREYSKKLTESSSQKMQIKMNLIDFSEPTDNEQRLKNQNKIKENGLARKISKITNKNNFVKNRNSEIFGKNPKQLLRRSISKPLNVDFGEKLETKMIQRKASKNHQQEFCEKLPKEFQRRSISKNKDFDISNQIILNSKRRSVSGNAPKIIRRVASHSHVKIQLKNDDNFRVGQNTNRKHKEICLKNFKINAKMNSDAEYRFRKHSSIESKNFRIQNLEIHQNSFKPKIIESANVANLQYCFDNKIDCRNEHKFNVLLKKHEKTGPKISEYNVSTSKNLDKKQRDNVQPSASLDNKHNIEENNNQFDPNIRVLNLARKFINLKPNKPTIFRPMISFVKIVSKKDLHFQLKKDHWLNLEKKINNLNEDFDKQRIYMCNKATGVKHNKLVWNGEKQKYEFNGIRDSAFGTLYFKKLFPNALKIVGFS